MTEEVKQLARRGKELSPPEVFALSVEARVNPRIAFKWLAGEEVNATDDSCVERAYKKLHG